MNFIDLFLTVNHEQYRCRATPVQNLCFTPVGVRIRLGGAIIWNATATTHSHAGMSLALWSRWLTAPYQRTGFGASVLAGFVRARCDS